ncbi:hypothetical protein OPV22_018941 [Ensete ventricosum]|uniref:Uncharacterized protein n=1 Tax=Ensete ventricosum TaxID=4639 RepID=A0AAV8PJP4_ENSVE|nr:hypothetical protein OPV22_018941 [Ensete ventricosum]
MSRRWVRPRLCSKSRQLRVRGFDRHVAAVGSMSPLCTSPPLRLSAAAYHCCGTSLPLLWHAVSPHAVAAGCPWPLLSAVLWCPLSLLNAPLRCDAVIHHPRLCCTTHVRHNCFHALRCNCRCRSHRGLLPLPSPSRQLKSAAGPRDIAVATTDAAVAAGLPLAPHLISDNSSNVFHAASSMSNKTRIEPLLHCPAPLSVNDAVVVRKHLLLPREPSSRRRILFYDYSHVHTMVHFKIYSVNLNMCPKQI